jgi:hypothetical protein
MVIVIVMIRNQTAIALSQSLSSRSSQAMTPAAAA